jgi:hypothetical protein
VQEFWFCEACKSMNRAGTERCYHCRAPRSGATMATVHERHLADMVMPGVDQLDPSEARALVSQHEYTTAWPLGYMAVLLLIPPLLFQAGLMGCAMVLAGAVLAPWSYSLSDGWWVALAACTAGFTFTLVLAAVVHSAFLWLTDANVPSLGGGSPRFAPWRAAMWWIESALWALRADAIIWVPIYLGDRAGLLVGPFGLVLTFSLMWLAIFLFGGPLHNVRKPARLLEDLTGRLALPGSSDESLPGLWSASWGTARLIDALTPLVVLVGSIVIVVSFVVQQMRMATGSPPAVELDFMSSVRTLAVLLILLALVESVANMIALGLLARLTASLAGNQKARRRWVLWSAGWSQGRSPSGQRPPSGYEPQGAPVGSPPPVSPPPVSPPPPARPPEPWVPPAAAAPSRPLAATPYPPAQPAPPSTDLGTTSPSGFAGEPGPAPQIPSVLTSAAEGAVQAGTGDSAELGPAPGAAPPAHFWPAPLLPQSQPRWLRTQQVVMTQSTAQPADRPATDEAAAPPKSAIDPSSNEVRLDASPATADTSAAIPTPSPGAVPPSDAEAVPPPDATPAPDAEAMPPNLIRDWPEGI